MTAGLFAAACVVLLAMYVTVLLKFRATELSYRQLLQAVPPAPGQVWLHDEQRLFVIRVDADGILWSFQHPLDNNYRPQNSAKLDSWHEWQLRIQHRQMVLQRGNWGEEER